MDKEHRDWEEALKKSRWFQSKPEVIWSVILDKNPPIVNLSKEIDEEDSRLVSPIIEKKLGEAGYKTDFGSIQKRHETGKLGEIAVCVHLGLNYKEVVDFSVGESSDFNHPDLASAGMIVGVKTGSREGDTYDYPLMKKPSLTNLHTYPQVIVMKEGLDFYICGLAEVETLNDPSNYSDTLIKSNDVRGKSAFKGFDRLKPLA